MKILIINPPFENFVVEYADEKGSSFIETADFGAFPPLGPLYVLSYLEKFLPGHELYFIDCIAEKVAYSALQQKVADIAPDVVGISSFTMALWDVCKTAEQVRHAAPGAHIC